jgi:hypothetical protein
MPKKNIVEDTHDKYQSKRGTADKKSFAENFVNKLRLDGGDRKGQSLKAIRKQLP